MKFIKKNKMTTIVIIIFIIAVILLYFAVQFFFNYTGSPKYGNRLDGIEEVEITNEDRKLVESKIKENKNVVGVTTNVLGRTLDITIIVTDKLALKDAKEIGNSSFLELSEEQISFYAIQVFIKKKDSTQNNFPIIGYKQKKTKTLVWTKDRKVTTTDETE